MTFDELKKKYQSGERKSIPTNKPVPERRRSFSPLTERMEKLGCFQSSDEPRIPNEVIRGAKSPFAGMRDETSIMELTAYLFKVKIEALTKRGYSVYDAHKQAKEEIDALIELGKQEEARAKNTTEEPILGEDSE